MYVAIGDKMFESSEIKTAEIFLGDSVKVTMNNGKTEYVRFTTERAASNAFKDVVNAKNGVRTVEVPSNATVAPRATSSVRLPQTVAECDQLIKALTERRAELARRESTAELAKSVGDLLGAIFG